METSSRETTTRQTAIVTGAGSGVGRDTALLLADVGYAVMLVGRTESRLRETVEYIRQEAHPAAELAVCPADVSRSADCRRVVAQTLSSWGRVDALVNCAGSAPLQPLDRLTDEIIDEALAVNLKSVIYMTREVWPTFRRQKRGAVVSVSSMASLDPFVGFNVYAAAKAGVNLFTRATADEGKRFNVLAVAIAPGAIETPMLRQNFSAKVIPQEKTLDPLSVAGLIRDIVTGAKSVENGQTIPLPSPR